MHARRPGEVSPVASSVNWQLNVDCLGAGIPVKV